MNIYWWSFLLFICLFNNQSSEDKRNKRDQLIVISPVLRLIVIDRKFSETFSFPMSNANSNKSLFRKFNLIKIMTEKCIEFFSFYFEEIMDSGNNLCWNFDGHQRIKFRNLKLFSKFFLHWVFVLKFKRKSLTFWTSFVSHQIPNFQMIFFDWLSTTHASTNSISLSSKKKCFGDLIKWNNVKSTHFGWIDFVSSLDDMVGLLTNERTNERMNETIKFFVSLFRYLYNYY